MALNPVVIAGSLSKEELEKSIQEIVNVVNSGMEKVSGAFDTKLAAIEENFKTAGTKIGTAFKDSFNAALGGSFDQLAAAMEKMSKASAKGTNAANTANANNVGSSGTKNKNVTYPEDSIGELRQQIKELQTKLNYEKRSTDELQKQFDLLHQAKAELKTQTTTRSFSSILGMPEKSATQIADKMKALRTVQVQNADEAKKLQNEYQRLSQRQKELLGNTNSLTSGNNALARSFGYIRNRLMYALTTGAVMNFVKQMYSVRAEYELLERSMGVLIDNFRRGSEIFNELNAMALKSPFTLVELGTAAKQLLAYNFAEDEVVDTTRRLADISAALGVPMERLVYNLGQIRAQTVLTARDARDFANAGLAIVPMLAKMYTEQKKFGDEIVTTAQVYDMMSKKLVTYEDVMKVINQVTDEGGKFFDFQAKQAETLKVQLANLTLAWNNMLNDIASSNQTALNTPIKLVKSLFQNWREVGEVLKAIIALFGMYIARARIVALVNAEIATQTAATAMYSLGRAVGFVVQAWKSLSVVVASNPIGAIATVATAGLVALNMFGKQSNELVEWTERFGESGGKVVRDIENLYASLESVNQESSTYKKVLGELNQILGDYGLQQISEKDSLDQIAASREKNIQLIKEEIIERERLNNINAGQEKYENKLKDIRANLVESLSDAITTSFGIGTVNQEIAKNAPAIATIVESIIEENIDLIADKSGEEFEKGQQKIWDKIQQALKSNKALGLSEKTLNSVWQENDWIRWNSNIIKNTISEIKEVKEEQNRWNRAIEEHAEIQRQDAQAGATFKDRVDQTSNSLMSAANDTEKFYKKIDTLIKDYSGQNIIDFLVRVKSQVPSWISKIGVDELTKLSARFASLAKNAKDDGLMVNGQFFTKAQLYERAAQYASALQTKTAELEARQTDKLTGAASAALKDYKSSLEAVTIAKNKLKQGTADSTLVTEKEAEAQKKYNAALKAGVSKKELEEARLEKKGSKKDELGDAVQDNIKYINEIRKKYEEYKKDGLNANEALEEATKHYTKSLARVNQELSKYGIQGLTGEKLATMNLQEVRDYFQNMLNGAQSSAKAVEVLEKALQNVDSEIIKFRQKTIIDSLNSELSKLKDEYELAVELDANPDWGESFASLFGINTDALPHDIEEYADRALTILNNYLKEGKQNLELPSLNLTPDDIKILSQLVQEGKLGEAYFNTIKQAFELYQNGIKKTAQDLNKFFEDYVSKYGTLEDKIKNIEKEKNDALEKLNLLYNTEALRQTEEYYKKRQQIIDDARRKQVKAEYEEFRTSEDYERFFTAIDTLTKGDALNIKQTAKQHLIEMLKAGALKASQFRKEVKALEDQFDKLAESKTNFQSYLSGGFDALIKKAKETAQEIEIIGQKIRATGKIDPRDAAYLDSFGKKFLDKDGIKSTFSDVTKSFGNDMQGLGNAVSKAGIGMQGAASNFAGAVAIVDTIVKNIHGTVQGVMAIIDELNQGRNDQSKIQNTFLTAFSNFDQHAASGWENLKSGNVMGAVTETVGSIVSIFKTFSLAANEKITKQVNQSVRMVSRLEIAYKNLERAISNAYGSEEMGATRVAIANKKLQLEELKRQLQLEESRSSKYKDEGKIISLRGQIVELKNDIEDMADSITNSFLGISSVSDAVWSMADAIVEALRSGEDAMEVFNNSIDDMIANMIKKVFAAKVIGPIFERVWKDTDARIREKNKDIAKSLEDSIASYENQLANSSESGFRFYKSIFGTLAKLSPDTDMSGNAMWSEITHDEWVELVKNEIEQLRQRLDDLTMPTEEDISYYAQGLESTKQEVQKRMEYLNNLIQQYGLEKETDKTLSALQQGIQGITEDTAGSIEAYMNGVSQQVYLQSNLLTQIRDAIVGFDLDVQLGVQSQILLELQNSYQVQMSIQNILQGVLNPSGRAFMVEMQ